MKILRYSLSLLLLVLVISSCKNNNTEVDYNANVQSFKDYIYVEDAFLDPFGTYFKAINDQNVMSGEQGWIDSAVVIYYPETNRLKFDYGAVPRKCQDGKFRQGNIWVDFDGPPNQTGTIGTFSFESHFVNKDLLQGSIYSEFLDADQGMSRYGYDVDQGILIMADTSYSDTLRLFYNSEFIMTWEEGEGTPGYYEDDVVTISGSTQGMVRDSREYTGSVTMPLNYYIMCNWIHSGMHNFTVPSADVKEGSIDYITNDACYYQVNFWIEENLFFEYLF
jgi:hypothetical protein